MTTLKRQNLMFIFTVLCYNTNNNNNNNNDNNNEIGHYELTIKNQF